MPNHPTKSISRNIPTDAHPNLEDEIRRLAFEIYVEHGREDGHDLDDWFLAEAEVLGAAVNVAA
ncbi:MAG: DUF2934 domain-containing protein [Acidobacteriia bacterium]|nr:DUF2934 domain-containing protein [Terriglobia bacterium]